MTIHEQLKLMTSQIDKMQAEWEALATQASFKQGMKEAMNGETEPIEKLFNPMHNSPHPRSICEDIAEFDEAESAEEQIEQCAKEQVTAEQFNQEMGNEPDPKCNHYGCGRYDKLYDSNCHVFTKNVDDCPAYQQLNSALCVYMATDSGGETYLHEIEPIKKSSSYVGANGNYYCIGKNFQGQTYESGIWKMRLIREGSKMEVNKKSYIELIEQDISWLKKQYWSLESEHIELVLKKAMNDSSKDEQITILKECARFYANEEHWNSKCSFGSKVDIADITKFGNKYCGGKIAREALRKVERV